MTIHPNQIATVCGLTFFIGQHLLFKRTIRNIKTKHDLKIPERMDIAQLKHIFLCDVYCKTGRFEEAFQILVNVPSKCTAATACRLFAVYNSEFNFSGCSVTPVLCTDDDGFGSTAWETFLNIFYEDADNVNDLYDGRKFILVLNETSGLVM